jgi:phosphoserine phosphatase RsbU/P
MNKSALFAEEEISWNPGDSFLFYTDGVLEARDAHGEEYGEGRLRESIKKARARNSGELPGALVASLREHASTFADDVTLVSVTLA